MNMKKTVACLVCIAAYVQSGAALAADRLVPSQYSTIQAAINAAVTGDVIRIAPGIYIGRIDLKGKGIRILGTAGRAQTFVLPNGSVGPVVSCVTGETSATILEGLTIMQSVGGPGVRITASSPTLRDCTLTQNQNDASNGGAVSIEGASTTVFERCDLLSNQASGRNGGAVAMSGTEVSVRFTLCNFNSNSATGDKGGALFADGAQVVIDRCAFGSNSVDSLNCGDRRGGAIYAENCGNLEVVDSSFNSNRVQSTTGFGGAVSTTGTTVASFVRTSFTSNTVASYPNCGDPYARGGALATEGGELALTQCVFTSNSTYSEQCCNRFRSSYGGAIYIAGGVDPVLASCDFTSNVATVYDPANPNGNESKGGTLYYAPGGSYGSITDCTFTQSRAEVDGGAIFLAAQARPLIKDCEISSSSVRHGTGGGIRAEDGANAILQSVRITGCSAVYGGGIYTRNSAVVMNFCTLDHNSSSQPGSALRTEGSTVATIPTIMFGFLCGNSGDDQSYWISGMFNNPSPQTNSFVANCGEDCNQNGANDVSEIDQDTVLDCNGNQIPDGCDLDNGTPDCNLNLIPDSCDVVSGVGVDCNENQVLDSCEIGQGPGDCDKDGILDACEILTNPDLDCNRNQRPDNCDLAAGGFDCDGDLIIDSCEIVDRVEEDCNSNGQLDDCEMAAGLPDCNVNNIPDVCEIALDPLLKDADGDGVLDSCGTVEFTGLFTEIVPIVNSAGFGLPRTAICYRIYATFSDPLAGLWAIYGNADRPLIVNAPGGFFQSPNGSNSTASVICDPPPAFDPGLRFDTWLTIDRICFEDNVLQTIGMNWSGWNAGGTQLRSPNGTIFVQPGSPQGYAGSDLRILVAQVTTMDGALPTGRLNLVGTNADLTDWRARSVAWPAPILVDCNENKVHDAYDIASGLSDDCDSDGVPDECWTPGPGTADCNGNGIADRCDIDSGSSLDSDDDGVPDECECVGDVDGNGATDVDDLIAIIVAWGDGADSPANLNGDDIVDAQDLVFVLGGWGVCL